MNEALWYAGRGTGVGALLLFTLVMVLGVLVRAGAPLPGLPRYAVAAVHRTTSLTALGFLAVHVVTLWLDPYAQLRVLDLVVPFLGAYRPLWQGLGTVALDLVVVLVVTSLLRHRIGLRTWQVLHATSYLCWPAAVAHCLGNGTDARSAWMLAVVAACVLAVVGVLLRSWRLPERAVEAPQRPAPVGPPAGLAGPR